MHDDSFLRDEGRVSFGTRGDPAPLMPSAAEPKPDVRALVAILSEVETIGTFVACAASIVNHAFRFPHRSIRLMAVLPNWLPPERGLRGGEGPWAKEHVPLPVLGRLCDLATRLGVARELTLQHCANVASSALVNPVAIDELAGLWGIACENALELLQEIQAELPLDQPAWGSTGAAGASAERLLAAAALGASPCVNINGAVEIPGWIERRSERRHRLRLDCELWHGGRVTRLRTINISRQGAGLVGSPVIEAGARASLVIGRLAEIPGTIVWRTAQNLGFRFDIPLESVADLGRSLLRL